MLRLCLTIILIVLGNADMQGKWIWHENVQNDKRYAANHDAKNAGMRL